MLLTSIEEVIAALKAKLPLYLEQKLNVVPGKHFHCQFHNDGRRPNMMLNHKLDNQVAHCFSCGKTADIFDFAAKLDDLPSHGAEFITVTLPTLAANLGIKIQLAEPTEASKIKAQHIRLLQDASDILAHSPNEVYANERNWLSDKIPAGTISYEKMIEKLQDRGWNLADIEASKLLGFNRRDFEDNYYFQTFFSEESYTMAIQDPYKKVVGFIARDMNWNSDSKGEKYFHSASSHVFQKDKILFGVHADLATCREKGLFLVEGPGEVQALHSRKIYNVAAVLGTAITENHLLEIKKLKIKKVIFALDWDKAGQEATLRAIDNLTTKVHDLSYAILMPPKDGEYKDLDEYLKNHSTKEFNELEQLSVFQYKLEYFGLKFAGDLEQIVNAMIPFVASEGSAVKRNLLCKKLAEYTGIDFASIETDVDAYRNIDVKEKDNAIKAAIQQFANESAKDPSNVLSLMTSLESEIESINNKHDKASFGVNYQVSRYQALQQQREMDTDNGTGNMFNFQYFKEFRDAFSGGMPLTRGVLGYFGGKANHGKTLLMLGLACDVALNDQDAIVIIHSIDDGYEQIEARLSANIYNMGHLDSGFELTIDHIVNSVLYKNDEMLYSAIMEAKNKFIELLMEERLVLLDATDGKNLSVVERNLRYYRNRYPTKKIMLISDNTHDYEDFPQLDQLVRMKLISGKQKDLAAKYNVAYFATVEYRKIPPSTNDNIRLPTNDDIADSRAMSYKPSFIIHVYNDLRERGHDNAEWFWMDHGGRKHPRIRIIVSKNKLTSWTGSLAADINPGSAFLVPKDTRDLNENSALPEQQRQKQKNMEIVLGYESELEDE